ncbi:cilia- and flagella-associated protein 184 [Patagioenas fasciata]|uniref:cilia- and flagella-associated protein 184 n=1 Tax=Patagioenas fasciata TaxID=372321 RepID=UPI0032E8D342
MEAAAEPEKLSPDAAGEPPGPEVLDGPCEPEKLALEEKEPPGLSEPSEPEVAAGPPGLSVAAPAAGGAGEEESSSEDESASTAPPAPPAEEPPVPPAPAVPGGAEQGGGQEDSAEENEEERQERDELLEQYGQLSGERDRLRQASSRLQMRLAQLLRLRQGARRPRAERGSAQLYGQLLRRLQELRQQRELVAADCRGRLEVRERAGEERQSRAQAEWTVFQARKKAVTVSSLCRQLGGDAAAKAAAHIQDREWDKERRVREARVENIKLKHEIQNLETTLKAQAEEAEGQPFVDLEQMKKENQKHSKRVDDLSDEILKLKKKVANAVHILSQFREKLQFVEADNASRKAELMDIEIDLAQKRDILTKSKQARDRLRKLNLKLQQQCGLLGNEILLRDFEEKVDAEELLSQQLETLKRHHAGLIVTCRGIQKKIKKANYSVLAEDN